jgi:tetratricopeptide (TPR) repeat protein
MRARWSLFSFCVVLCGAPALTHAQMDSLFDAVTRRGIDAVYNLEFETAERDFRDLVAMQPRAPAGHFFLAMVQWWRIVIDIDNEQYDRSFCDSLDLVIDLCDSMLERNDRDVTAIFFKGGAIGFQGRLRFHRDDYIGAANAGRKALPLVQAAQELDPNNYDILLGSGMYNYYADVIPEEYPIVKPLLLFIPKGDKTKGIQQLELAAEKGKYASIETTYFLVQLYYYYERDFRKALALASKLHARFPNNMLFHKYVGRCYYSLSEWPMVEREFEEIAARARRGQRGYTASAEREAEYYVGICAMIRKEYETALGHLYRCDELSRGIDRNGPSGFMAMANLKVGMIFDATGKRDLAVSQYRKVLDMKEYRDSHELAEAYLHTPFVY